MRELEGEGWEVISVSVWYGECEGMWGEGWEKTSWIRRVCTCGSDHMAIVRTNMGRDESGERKEWKGTG